MDKAYTGVYIDSNIFTGYARNQPNSSECKRLINLIVNKFSESEKIKFFVWRFSGVEIASALRRKKSRKDAEAFSFKKDSLWEKIFLPLPPNPKEKFEIKDFIRELIEIALKFGTDFSDTIQTHSIETYKEQIDIIITEDKDYKNRLQKRYKRIKIYSLKDDICNILNKLHKNKENDAKK